MSPQKPPPRPDPAAPRVDRDSPARQPLVAPARARQASQDDLSGLQADDARETALRAAAVELDRKDAALRATEVRAAEAEAARDRAAAEVGRLSAVAPPPAPPPGPPVPPQVTAAEPEDAKAFRAQGKSWRVVVPLGVVAALVAPATALIQHFVGLDQRVGALERALAGSEKRDEERSRDLKAANERTTALTIVVAKMSGFLEKSFAKVGLDVKAEAGAEAIEFKTEPADPRQAPVPKRQQIRVRTLIPAPAPPKGR